MFTTHLTARRSSTTFTSTRTESVRGRFGDRNCSEARQRHSFYAGAFFVPATYAMAGCMGRPKGLPVPSDIGSPTLCSPSPSCLATEVTVSLMTQRKLS